MMYNIPSMGAVARLPWTFRGNAHRIGREDTSPECEPCSKPIRSGSIESRATVWTLGSEAGEDMHRTQNESVDDATLSISSQLQSDSDQVTCFRQRLLNRIVHIT